MGFQQTTKLKKNKKEIKGKKKKKTISLPLYITSKKNQK
jgi:hypothetical protein